MTADYRTLQILATEFCLGRMHDFQMFKNGRYAIAGQIEILADLGYLGIDKLHSNSQIPAKNSKLHKLTEEQKSSNRELASRRILIENIIRKLKVFRILSERYRNRRKRFSLRFNLIAAIYNFELQLT